MSLGKTQIDEKKIVALLEKIEKFPTNTGVYLMKNINKKVIYVGKATNLKNRVKSYFNGQDSRSHIYLLLRDVFDIEFSITTNDRDALILEDILIKKYKPKYNIKLRDDKTYLSLAFSIQHPFPKIYFVRKRKEDGSLYFGPFASTNNLRKTLDLIQRLFQLRTCKDNEFKRRTRPCLQYQIKRCIAPCVGLVDQKTYNELARQTILILEGKDQELVSELKKEMINASDNLEFELAAELRNKIQSLELLSEDKQIVNSNSIERDIIGFHRESDELVISLIPVRNGKMQDHNTFYFSEQISENEEILSSFLIQKYKENDYIPKEILIPFHINEKEAIEEILKDRAKQRIIIKIPQRGEKTRLVDLAETTAKATLTQEIDRNSRAKRAMKELQKIMQLDKIPVSLECFDISNISGQKAVASKVRFENGEPSKSGYRRYKIKTLEETPNDFGMMKEVLKRRIKRGLDENELPDVLIVDGGKGQLSIAVSVLNEMNIATLPVLGFAKPDKTDAKSRSPILIDKIFLPGRKNPIVLPQYSPLIKVLQSIRDESHRFAITYHRKLRSKALFKSILEDIPGIGKKRSKLLLKEIGSVKKLKESSVDDLTKLSGISVCTAKEILSHLNAKELLKKESDSGIFKHLKEDMQDLDEI